MALSGGPIVQFGRVEIFNIYRSRINIHSILDGKTAKGGVSPHTGGRDERPPQVSGLSAPPSASKSKWIPPSCVKRDVSSVKEKNDSVFRKVRGILNKLTPDKFDKLSLELLNVGIESQVILKGIILLIFEKALEEPKYSTLYAQLCHRLCEDAPNFEPPNSNISTFRRLLLNKCQDEFENRSKATEVYDKRDLPLDDEEHEQYHVAKGKMLGNIKFIGELGKLEMLHEGILHKCIKQLLEKKKNVPVRDMAEDLECLCQIMRTVGRRLDTPKAKAWMDQYFVRIAAFACNMELPSRIRFMLQDVLELRRKKWVPRKVVSDAGPRTIAQIRQEAADETGVFIPSNHAQMPTGRMARAMNGGLPPNLRGSMADVFGLGPGMMGTIGTGPGVITMDSFMSSFPGNSSRNRGNQQNQGFNPQYSGNNRRSDSGSPRGNRRGNNTSPQPNNQNQSSQQRQSPSNRDLPPRFQKMSQGNSPGGGSSGGSGGSKEEISLRPARNFMVFKPSAPSMLPRSAQLPPVMNSAPLQPPGSQSDIPNPLLQKQAQVTIKQVSQDKNKAPKKQVLNREETLKAANTMLEEYLESGDMAAAIATLKDIAVNKYIPEILTKALTMTIDLSDDDKREEVMVFIAKAKSENLISPEQFQEAFEVLLDQMAGLENEIPLVRSYTAKIAAWAVSKDVVTLTELSTPMENGSHYPLFLLCLQQMHKVKDKDWLINIFNDSKINLQNMLPESERNKERMMEILEDRSLTFLFPLLRVQADLVKQIQADPNAASIYKWIKERVDTSLLYTPNFVNILTSSLLKYITQESGTVGESVDLNMVADKASTEKEKLLLDKMKGVLQKFLHDNIKLQIASLYSVQVFCFNLKFPKGMILRLFMHLYDMEIVEEESFIKWKEEVNDEYPGKGKALFQVNQWLTWLEQAEEETDEEDEDE
ncbi:eukaryotic translation initiation factor 4 gamma 2-like [Liolophura sinensis]|uniref:eukaryotic translation initiation factor 4 gamma 2-like n=1 Tax=Liolophura sinensis TaxID=3198878 RepID=UPI0031587959